MPYLCYHFLFRLRVVSNFGDSDPGAGENTHTRGRKFGETRRNAREAPKIRVLPSFLALPSRRVRDYSESLLFYLDLIYWYRTMLWCIVVIQFSLVFNYNCETLHSLLFNLQASWTYLVLSILRKTASNKRVSTWPMNNFSSSSTRWIIIRDN